MQDQNDNMDDLFRKAAEDYPLNVAVPDWNKIAVAVSSTENAPARSERRYRRFLWLLLLIPVGFASAYFASGAGLFDDDSDSNQNVPANNAAATTKNNNTDRNINLSSDDDSLKDNNLPSKNTKPSEKDTSLNTIANPRVREPRTDISIGTNENIPDSPGNNKRAANNGMAGTSSPVILKRNAETPVPNGQLSTSPGADKQRSSSRDKLLASFAPAPVRYNKAKSKHHKRNHSREFDSARPRQQVLAEAQDLENDLEDRLEPSLNIQTSRENDTAGIEPGANIPGSAVSPAPVTNLNRKRDPRFYIGIAAGADLSSVKLQKFSRTGSQYGGIIGYQFAKRWSVEAGLFLDTKYYYTDGEYFDKSGLTVNPSSKILTVDGVCRMLELPVSVKYDLSNTYKSNWFVTAGLSSYIMKKENYDMLYLYTGSGSTSVHKYEYKNSSRNFFSQLRLTAGYSYKLPRNFSLRLEPYVNIPVSGVGYGKLNLNSAGINAGIFKRLF